MDEKDDGRERAIDKIRKLLAMANDGGGNENEMASAARQAESMMRKFQVESADVVMREVEREDAFDRGTEDCYFGPRDPRYVPSKASSWVGVVGVGCGAAFTCKVDSVFTDTGAKMRFSGYKMDVELCRHVFQVLCAAVYRLSVQNYKGKGSASKAFRSGAAGTLQKRLFEIRDQRNAENRQAGNGTALVLYDRKAQRVAEMFGKQRTKSTAPAKDRAAYLHGQLEGASVAINLHRPLGQQNLARLK